MLAALAKVPFVSPEKQPQVVRLDDDWLTKGDWLGRHGRYWACLCAASASSGGLPKNYIWGAGPEKVEYWPVIGPNHNPGDGLRHWVHWQHTKNPNSLELTSIYLDSRVQRGLTTWDVNRRQSEWDDHGEAYPMSKDGPGLCCPLQVPAGLFYLSIYDFNKDGHSGNNRLRDYRLSIRTHPGALPLYKIDGLEAWPELARGRVRDFWGGSYKRFLVRGPAKITVYLGRNHSFNAILAGVMLDLVDEYPVPYFRSREAWKTLCAEREKEGQLLMAVWGSPADRSRRLAPGQTEGEAAARLFGELERVRLVNAAWWAREGRPFYSALARWHAAALENAPAGNDRQRLYASATTCYYQLGLLAKWEAGQTLLGTTSAREIEKSLRWDRQSACSGKGYEILSARVQAQGAKIDKVSRTKELTGSTLERIAQGGGR